MKRTLLLALFCVVAFALKAQEITLDKVPTVVQEKFKAEHSDIPAHIKPSWYLDKAVGSERALFKVSYMVTGGFETYLYSHSGEEVYRIKDYYKTTDAPQTVVTNLKAAYTASSLSKVSEYSSTKYNMKGYLGKYEDFKSKYADANGVASTVNPARSFAEKADADPTNFVAAPTAPSTPASGSAPASTPAKAGTTVAPAATTSPTAPKATSKGAVKTTSK